ncbi:MAG: hypothetical protein M3383_03420 [Actinomycetota bacterium]|nr:hypothetical protein [Actinomycetota bacterium]
MTRALRTFATVGAAAALVAGCSSSETKNEYVDTVNEIQTSALEAFNQATAATPESQKELVDQLEAGEEALADAVTRLEEVEVPDEAETDHPALIAGIDELRELFAETATKAKKGSAGDTLDAVTRLSTDGTKIGTRIDDAISRINEALGAA